MRAVVYAGRGEVRLDDVTEPTVLEPTDAVVRLRRSAVCGTDLHVLAHPEGLHEGDVLGHEMAGEVVDVGDAVRGVRPGDLVAGSDFTSCGGCWWCRRGDHWHCPQRRFFGTGTTFGPRLAGCQADLVRVPFADTALRAVPESLSLDAAVLLGDTVATGYAAVQRSGLRPGDTLAVVGGGPVGQLTALAAQACGAGVVVVVEPVEARRVLAVSLGALARPPQTARELLLELTAGRGCDVVVDAVGGPVGLDTAFSLVRPRGEIVSVGVHHDETWSLPVARAFREEVGLRFAIGDFARDADALTALVAAGTLDPTPVASTSVRLEDAPEAYAEMAARRILKAVIKH
ncbi:MAG: alcohol dehydrogenase catalytic domain-containing protein [Janthinobacterium lividum]